MPIYEYRCKSCGKEFEVIQQSAQRQLRTCRDCSGRLEKLVSRSAFHLKGGGWYSEGYNKDAKKSEGAKKEDSKKEGAKKEGAKKEGSKAGEGKSGSSSEGSKSASGGKKD